MYFSILFGELVLLFFLSSQLSKSISLFLFTLSHSKRLVVWILSFLFLPGTLIHEFAHYFLAVLLRVRVVGMTVIPHIEGETVKLGSVTMEKADPVRWMIIGVAPFLVGMTLLASLSYYVFPRLSSLPLWEIVICAYIVFEISNTMFSSKKDMEGTGLFLLILIVVSVIGYLLGVRIPPEMHAWIRVLNNTHSLQHADLFLLIPVSLDILTISISRSLTRLFL